jgi:hypothetical protein
MSKRIIVIAAILLTGGAVAAVAFAGGEQDAAPEVASGHSRVIESSYAFDVSNKRYVAGYADAVVIGRVAGRASQSEPYTTYDIDVIRALKGSPPPALTARQLGYVDDDGVAHETEDQPLLDDGRVYVLALTGDAGGYTIVGGPAAAARADGGEGSPLVREYQQAVREQREPPGVPPRAGP